MTHLQRRRRYPDRHRPDPGAWTLIATAVGLTGLFVVWVVWHG
jgi:hypothetical protein